jgi:hypothetical protein
MQRDTRYADAKVIETQIAEGRARNAQAHRLAMLDAAWRASLTCVATSHTHGLHPRGMDRNRVVDRHQRSAKREIVFRELGHSVPAPPSQPAQDVLDTDRRCEDHGSDRLNVVEMRHR